MFATISLLAAGLLALSPSAYLPPVMQIASAAVGTIESLTIPSFDAYPLEGRLYLPPDQPPSALVIYVNGSGPNTNQNTRNFQPIQHFPTLIWLQAASMRPALPFSVTAPAA